MELGACAFWVLEICDQGFGATNAVGGCAHDAAGIPGSLTARVEAWGRYGVARSVSGDGDRRARTRLHAGEDGIGAVVAAQLPAEQGKSQAERVDDMMRKGVIDRRPGHAKWIGGLHLSGCRAGASRKEISDELCRCIPVGTAQTIGGRLASSLELNACKRIIAGKVVGRYIDE